MTWKPAPMERISSGQISVARTCMAVRGGRRHGRHATRLGKEVCTPAIGEHHATPLPATSVPLGAAHPRQRADGDFEEHLKQAQHHGQRPGIAVCEQKHRQKGRNGLRLTMADVSHQAQAQRSSTKRPRRPAVALLHVSTCTTHASMAMYSAAR